MSWLTGWVSCSGVPARHQRVHPSENLHYGFDFCPAFWDWLDQANRDGRAFSIERVATEISAGDDELSDWAGDRPRFFIPAGSDVLPSLRAVSEWAMSGDYEAVAVNTFLQVADYYEAETTHKLHSLVEYIQLAIAVAVTIVMALLTLVSSESAVVKPRLPTMG